MTTLFNDVEKLKIISVREVCGVKRSIFLLICQNKYKQNFLYIQIFELQQIVKNQHFLVKKVVSNVCGE